MRCIQTAIARSHIAAIDPYICPLDAFFPSFLSLLYFLITYIVQYVAANAVVIPHDSFASLPGNAPHPTQSIPVFVPHVFGIW